MIWESTTSTALLTSFFASVPTAALFYFGPDSTVPFDKLSLAQNQYARVIDVTDPKRAFVWLAGQAQVSGAVVNRVVAAPSDAPADIALAGAYARRTGALLAPAGANATLTTSSRLDEYLRFWKAGTFQVVLAGINLTAANLTAVSAPTLLPLATAPAFRVVGLTKNASDYTLTVSAVASATQYDAFDAEGTLLSSSATPSLSFVAQPSGLLVVASGTSGEIAHIDIRVNDYSEAGQRPSGLLASAASGTNHLVFLSALKVPRLITRSTTDPFAEIYVEQEQVPVAIVCGSMFTDAGLDPTKQYEYTVAELTNVDARACDPTAAIAPATNGNLISAGVPIPPTEFPPMFSQRESGPRAHQTLMDRLVASSDGTSTAASRGPGDGWDPLLVRWVAYIPESRVPFPGYSGDPAKPLLAFSGDNHGSFSPNSSARFKQDLKFTFGTGHAVTYAESMGASHKLKCSLAGVCTTVATATAPLSELNWNEGVSTATGGSAHVWAAATIPLVDGAPAIDTDWRIRFSTSGSMAFGYHDNMPKHELYIGFVDSFYNREYSSPYVGWIQLPCLFVPHELPLTKCSTWFNVQL